MVGTHPNRRAMRVYPMAELLVLAVVLVVLASGQSARAQTVDVVDWTGAEWNSDYTTVTLYPDEFVEVSTDTKCARWNDGEPQELVLMNGIYKLYGICLQRTSTSATVTIHYSPDSPPLPKRIISDMDWETDTGTVIVQDDSNWRRKTHFNAYYGSDLVEESALVDSVDLSPTETIAGAVDHVGNSTTPLCTENNRRRGSNDNYPGSGWVCLTTTDFESLSAGQATELQITLYDEVNLGSDYQVTDENNEPPGLLTATRDARHEEVTVTWDLPETSVGTYQIERSRAIVATSGDLSSIQYGETTTVQIRSGELGRRGAVRFTDSGLVPRSTYRYRVRAGNADSSIWTGWGNVISAGVQPLDLPAPGNLEVLRGRDNASVTVQWTKPDGEVDTYAVQRQELVIVESSTIFANTITLADDLSPSTLAYTDESISPGRTYEYRIAAVRGGVVGDYTDWARVTPFDPSLGKAPENLHFVDDETARLLDDRREFWVRWDELDGADNYEVDVLVYDVATGGQSMESYIVTDPKYFRTAYGRTDVRTRGRKHDSDLCGSGAEDRCYSEWTGWYSVRFTPAVTIAAPPLVDDTADPGIMELRENTVEAIETSLGAAGASVDADVVLQFLFVVAATVVGGISIALAWRLGMAPLGVGMGAAVAVLILFVGFRLYGIPLAWPVAMQAALAVAGMFALVRQTGVFR